MATKIRQRKPLAVYSNGRQITPKQSQHARFLQLCAELGLNPEHEERSIKLRGMFKRPELYLTN